MKNITFLLGFGFFCQTVQGTDNIVDISSHQDHVCVLASDRAACFGNNEFGQSVSVEGFSGAKQIVSGLRHNCVLDEEGIWCWGEERATSVPLLDSPRFLAETYYGNCALTLDGYSCWGVHNNQMIPMPDLQNINMIDVYYGIGACALAAGRVHCWDSRGTHKTPRLKEVTHFAYDYYTVCALNSGKLACWDYDYGEHNYKNYRMPRFTRDLEEPSQVTVVSGKPCVLDAQGIQCANEELVPDFGSKVPQIMHGKHGTLCSAVDDRFICKGKKAMAGRI